MNRLDCNLKEKNTRKKINKHNIILPSQNAHTHKRRYKKNSHYHRDEKIFFKINFFLFRFSLHACVYFCFFFFNLLELHLVEM